MSQVLTVPTHFNDLGELSEGFLDRIEQDTLILYGPVAYEDGSEIEFVVLLADGSPALEGTGRVRAAVDGGADRVPETRYDVVVEALQLDGRSEVVFERLVLARQSVSDHPPAEGDAPPTDEMDVVPADEDAPDTVPPEAIDEDDEDEYDDEPATVIAAVDAQAMMAEAEAEAASVSEPVSEAVPAAESVPASEAVTVSGSEPALEFEDDDKDNVVVEASKSEASDGEEEPAAELSADAQAALEANADQEGRFDSEYAFEHGIAAEPQVGMPVPIPSMAAPPEAPPAPPTLRLADPPEGLMRPSLAQVEESPFNTDGEVSDVHTTGLFAYENGLPIPSRPPLPDLNRPASVRPVEAAGDSDVEESEPPEANDDEYEEVRLSDFAEAAEEG